jgi:hypothetical protein
MVKRSSKYEGKELGVTLLDQIIWWVGVPYRNLDPLGRSPLGTHYLT